MEKEYSFSCDAKATVSGIVKARSLEEAVEKVMSYDDLDVSELDFDLPYGFSDYDTEEKAYALGLQIEK